MANGELFIKQVQTAWNVADLNTKGLSRDRFLGLLYMLGFVNENEVQLVSMSMHECCTRSP